MGRQTEEEESGREKKTTFSPCPLLPPAVQGKNFLLLPSPSLKKKARWQKRSGFFLPSSFLKAAPPSTVREQGEKKLDTFRFRGAGEAEERKRNLLLSFLHFPCVCWHPSPPRRAH